MHPNTENSFRISFATAMFGFLLDILPLESGDDDDENEEKGGGSNSIVEEKKEFIYTNIPKDKSAD